MEKNRILVVDDDIDIINVLRPFLEKEGYKVETAFNKNEGIVKAKNFKPGLIILDVMMISHYEGFEMREELTKDPELKNIPVIILTSVDVLTTNKPDVQAMAREFRQNPIYKGLQVLLIKDTATGAAGIDYLADDGTTHFIPVEGFIKKPVNTKSIITEVKRIF